MFKTACRDAKIDHDSFSNQFMADEVTFNHSCDSCTRHRASPISPRPTLLELKPAIVSLYQHGHNTAMGSLSVGVADTVLEGV